MRLFLISGKNMQKNETIFIITYINDCVDGGDAIHHWIVVILTTTSSTTTTKTLIKCSTLEYKISNIWLGELDACISHNHYKLQIGNIPQNMCQ